MNENQAALNVALLNAAIAGDAKIVAAQLALGADPNSRHGVDDSTPLMMALSKGKHAVVETLMSASDLFLKDKDGSTLLMLAAAGSPDSIASLLPVSNVLARDNIGRTALMHAARKGKLASITALAPLGGLSEKDDTGMTAMDWAMFKTSSTAFATVRHLKSLGKEMGLDIEEAAAPKAPRRGL